MITFFSPFGKRGFSLYNLTMLKKNFNFHPSLPNRPVDCFSWLGMWIIGLVIWSVFLATSGLFYKFFLWIYLAPGLIFLGFIFYKFFRRHRIFRRQYWVALVLIALSVLIVSLTTPSLFSGRDEGALAESAIRLVQNGGLEASFPAEREFFKLYGPGVALNFPGFDYTASGRLVSQFPLGYFSWLAVGYTFFGPKGFAVANGIALALFFLSFYALLRRFLSARNSLAAILFLATNFIFWWFPKFTLSENLALFLTWFFVFQFVQFLKTKERFALLAAFLSVFALILTRVEGWAFLLAMFLFLIVYYRKNISSLKKIIGSSGYWIISLSFLLMLFTTVIHHNYYWSILKGLIKPFLVLNKTTGSFNQVGGEIFYLVKVFFIYAIFYIILLGLISLLRLIRHRDWELLVPFFLTWPGLFYLVFPSISLDHPWLFRRFMFAIVPLMVFYAIILLSQLFRRKNYFLPLITLLILTNILVAFPLAIFTPYRTLLGQVSAFSKNFQNTDLILVDRLATGDPWSMMSGPLNFFNGKQAVYFFNLGDLDKIDRGKFTKTYLVISDNQWDAYSTIHSRLTPVKDYTFTFRRISVWPVKKDSLAKEKVLFPNIYDDSISGKVYLLN